MLNVILKSLQIVILSAIVLAGGWYLFPEITWRRNLNWLMYRMAEDAATVVAATGGSTNAGPGRFDWVWVSRPLRASCSMPRSRNRTFSDVVRI